MRRQSRTGIEDMDAYLMRHVEAKKSLQRDEGGIVK